MVGLIKRILFHLVVLFIVYSSVSDRGLLFVLRNEPIYLIGNLVGTYLIVYLVLWIFRWLKRKLFNKDED